MMWPVVMPDPPLVSSSAPLASLRGDVLYAWGLANVRQQSAADRAPRQPVTPVARVEVLG
jgi:hypothetical protein